MVVDEMVVENWHERELMESGAFADQPERSHVLVYVVDLSGPAPWNELRMLREELGKYKVGMSRRARMVIESSLTMTCALRLLDELALKKQFEVSNVRVD